MRTYRYRFVLALPCAAIIAGLCGAGCSRSLPETPSIASPAPRTPGVYRSGSSLESIPADKARQMLNDPKTPEATKRMLRQRADL